MFIYRVCNIYLFAPQETEHHWNYIIILLMNTYESREEAKISIKTEKINVKFHKMTSYSWNFREKKDEIDMQSSPLSIEFADGVPQTYHKSTLRVSLSEQIARAKWVARGRPYSGYHYTSTRGFFFSAETWGFVDAPINCFHGFLTRSDIEGSLITEWRAKTS